jgi:8-amino-7-oxononanoate synthase
MHAEDWIVERLRGLREDDLYRSTTTYADAGGHVNADGRKLLNLASNDYLNLAQHPDVIAAAKRHLDQWGAGATASRLVTGTLPCHQQLEERLATHKSYARAVLFGSGYMANVGVITTLVGRGDHVFADRLVHASLIEGVLASRATLHRFQHNDPDHLAALLSEKSDQGRCLVVTESVFSMDGDLAPLAALGEIAVKNDAMLLVDDAHATGVYGPQGAGRVAEENLQGIVNITIGTFSKGLGGYGGFAVCSESMAELMINRSRSFIYTTAPAPAAVGAAMGALDVLQEHPEYGQDLLARAARFRQTLEQQGLETGAGTSHIIPLLIGDSAATLAVARELHDQGVLVVAFRPPTVPEGSARLRLAPTLAHSDEELAQAAETIAAVAGSRAHAA